ncbi:peptide/nickel transport system substrate-binding protein [Cereibacter ovatus]|uniref:Peptide/nickel transport system substrate-binding protein n=1 Tax=Cereibacter ovatus TaxID=439529 RepID=A0A285D1E6_9RHOB|nr:extracellular solute-binding protein [Cereibacter ovatus]SNX73657.1 peptide/nickel transport system substrate-binding protein [Cereibacter ovatus]
MIQEIRSPLRRLGLALALVVVPSLVAATPRHGIAMYGEPALPPDFVFLPYANPDAPKGGRIVLGETGGFDSLNPFIVKGRAPATLAPLTIETLMGRSLDEPFSLYGLLAESIETDPARTWVEFTLREGARFSDGAPVTVEDVLWSFEVLGTKGMPRYWVAWKKIARAEATGPRTVRFTFNTEDRELPLILGLRPILQKAQWQGRDFAASGVEVPVGSGPYVVDSFEPGRVIRYRRNPDWWGKDLPFNRGLHNLDGIVVEYFGDGGVAFEAFKSGALSSFREGNAAKWAVNYDFPAVRSGEVVRSEIPHGRPSGIEGLVMNTRRPVFADWRVREAMIQAFNFELVNRTLTGGTEPRIVSYFSNSALGMVPGTPAEGRERALLAPFAADLPPGALEGYALPVSDGSEANRKGLRAATRLLAEAGWQAQDGTLRNAAGQPFAFEILLPQGADTMLSAATIYRQALARLGIAARITTVDPAQYKQRVDGQDFDMTHFVRSLSLSPGNEQVLYWSAEGRDEPGSRNLMGMDSPAAEAIIRHMLTATDPDEFRASVRALDRVLTAGRYVIPIWYSAVSRLAHDRRLRYPQKLPIYGDWPGFQPDVWWYQD